MTPSLLLALVVGVAASLEDLLRRRVSNWTPVLAVVGGAICGAVDNGWHGFGSAMLGTLAGFGVFLVFYLLGGLGGGDVKLMAGFGALLGASRLVQAALLTAVLGGVFAVFCLAVRMLRRRFRGGTAEAAGSDSIPYAPAITLGAWLVMWAG